VDARRAAGVEKYGPAARRLRGLPAVGSLAFQARSSAAAGSGEFQQDAGHLALRGLQSLVSDSAMIDKPERRFPPPRIAEETDACFIVRYTNGPAFFWSSAATT
jgi:hypothetical protein